jgi:GAF domain-containing protein
MLHKSASFGPALDACVEEVLRGIAEGRDFKAALQAALDLAIAIAGAEMGNIQLLDGKAGSLRIAASRGFYTPFLRFFASVDGHANSACAAAMTSRMRIIVNDVATNYLFVGTPALEVMLAAGARAVHSTPMVSRNGRLIGVLSTHWRRPLEGMSYDPTPLDRFGARLAHSLAPLEAIRCKTVEAGQ